MRTIFSVIVSIGIASAHADVPAVAAERPGAIATIEAHPVPGILPIAGRTILGIVVGQTELTAVMRKLGKVAPKKMENEDGRPVIACYRSSDRSDDTMVVYEAGPLGGFQTVTAVTVGHAPDFGSLVGECLATARVTRSATHAGTLRIGGQLNDTAKALKVRPVVSKAGVTEIALEKTVRRKQRSGADIEADVSSGVAARVEDGKIRWFVVYYTESS